MEPEYGDYGKYLTAGKFLSRSKEKFVRDLVKKIKSFYGECDKGEIKAWEDCYDVLTVILSELPEAYWNLWMIFEYVIPQNKPGTKKFKRGLHRRADVILLSSDKVLVMEFKQSKGINQKAFEKHVRQAGMYKRKLDKYHDASRDMEVLSVLVLSKARNRREEQRDCIVCSPDRLANEIMVFMGNVPQPYTNVKRWLRSTYSAAEEEN